MPEQLSFLSPMPTTHEVDGVALEFYPVSLGAAMRLRQVGGPLAKAMATLFAARNTDTTKVSREARGVDAGVEVVEQAISPELAKLRHDQNSQAIQAAVDALTDPKTLTVVAGLLKDSMRAGFESLGSGPPEKVVEAIPLPAFTQLFHGVLKANAGVLGDGPFAKALASAGQRAREVVERAQAAPLAPAGA